MEKVSDHGVDDFERVRMKFKLSLALCLISTLLIPQPAFGLEKPTIESFNVSKLELDLTDPDFSIEFEVVISHPKGIENDSTLLIFSNSLDVSLSVPLIRSDYPINYANSRVTFKGKLNLPRSLRTGVYTYTIDGVRNNIDSGTRFTTGIVSGEIVRNLKGAESGILIRSNGYLNLDYETINGPAFGSQSGISYLNPRKYAAAKTPIWKVGEIFDSTDYFENAIPSLETYISSLTPSICISDRKKMTFVAEGQCNFRVFTEKNKDYLEKSKVFSATISGARSVQVLRVESVSPLKPTSLPTSILLSPVYASGTSSVEYVLPKSLTPTICEAGGYVLKIQQIGTCTLSYKSDGNANFLPSDIYTQDIKISNENLPVVIQTPIADQTPIQKSEVTKTISCVKDRKTITRSGTRPKCPSGYKFKK
jgi:hypothetical protein